MADPTSDTPVTPEDASRPRATIKLKPMPGAAAAAAPAAEAAAGAADAAEPAIPLTPPPSAQVPGAKQTIKLRPPTPAASASPSEVKPAIKIVPKAAEEPTGIPTAKPVEAAAPAAQTIQLKKAESSTPTIQLKKPESSTPTIQLKKPESSTPTIQLKKPESSTPTIQLKKPESEEAAPAPAKKVGEAPVPPERKLTLKLKNQPAATPPPAEKQEEKKDDAAAAPATPPPERKLTLKLKNQPSKPQEMPRNLIPGLNIPSTPPPIHKEEDQKNEAVENQQTQPPVAAPVETQTPVPEAAADGKKKKGKLPKVKKQPAAPTSADEPNWFFLTLSCLVLIAVCFVAYILFAQYMNMYEEMQIPVPGFLMPK